MIAQGNDAGAGESGAADARLRRAAMEAPPARGRPTCSSRPRIRACESSAMTGRHSLPLPRACDGLRARDWARAPYARRAAPRDRDAVEGPAPCRPAAHGSRVGAQGFHRLLGIDRHRALASADAGAAQGRLQHAARSTPRRARLPTRGTRQGVGGDRPVQGLRPARPDAGARARLNIPLDRRQHAPARHGLRHADAHLPVRRRAPPAGQAAAAAGLLRGVLGISRARAAAAPPFRRAPVSCACGRRR